MPKKRANGEGSIRKRKDGRWEGRYTAGCDPTTGKPIHKSVLAKTQSEAKKKLKQAIAEAEKLDMSRAKSYTLGAWIKLWYEVYAEPRLREKTKDYYLNYIDNHIIPELGNTPLEKLTTIQIQKFYNDLQKSGRIQRYTHIKLKDKGLSTRVVRGIHTLLNNCLEQAVAERLLLTNPAKGCRLPKLEKREMKILPEDKIGPYLAEAERRGLLAAFYLELTTGLRRGELLALLWTDLDVENMTISVSKQVNRIDRCPAFIKLREHLLLNRKLVRNRLYKAFLRLLLLTREQLNLGNQVFHKITPFCCIHSIIDCVKRREDSDHRLHRHLLAFQSCLFHQALLQQILRLINLVIEVIQAARHICAAALCILVIRGNAVNIPLQAVAAAL